MARKNYARKDRISAQIQRELADILRFELKDPRLGLVTITEVEVTRDHSHATIFYTVLPDEQRAQAQDILSEARGFLRSQLSRRIRIFSVPELHFEYDHSIERGMNMNSLLAKVAHDDAQLPENPASALNE